MTSRDWFDVRRFPHDVIMIAEPGHNEDVKSYLVEGDQYVAVLDVGMGFANFKALADSLSDREPIVLLSHAHFDHIGDAHKYERVLVHPAEADALRAGVPNDRMREFLEPRYLNDGYPLPADLDPETIQIPGCEPSAELNHGDIIDLGGRTLEVFHTPGHSPGGITLLDQANRLLFPGDAVYMGPMFAWRPYADPVAYRETLRLLAELADEVDTVYPAHNRVPMTPDEVRMMHRAYEEIWSGREPDERRPDRDIFRFDGFEFWLRSGAYGDA